MKAVCVWVCMHVCVTEGGRKGESERSIFLVTCSERKLLGIGSLLVSFL